MCWVSDGWVWLVDHATIIATVVSAIAAGFIAYFTIVLAGSTQRLWAATVAQGKIAERTLTDLERPYIFIYGVLFQRAVPVIGAGPFISYSVSNNGKLAARIETVTVRCGFPFGGHKYPPPIIVGDHYLLQQPILGPSAPPVVIAHSELPQDQVEYVPPMRHPKDGLIFQVVIAYRGPATKGHETGQGWRYDKSTGGFVEIADSAITYTR